MRTRSPKRRLYRRLAEDLVGLGRGRRLMKEYCDQCTRSGRGELRGSSLNWSKQVTVVNQTVVDVRVPVGSGTFLALHIRLRLWAEHSQHDPGHARTGSRGHESRGWRGDKEREVAGTVGLRGF